jgi:hypothetical protein
MALRPAKEAIPVAADGGCPVRAEAPPVRHDPRREGPPEAPGWTTGRIVSLVIGAVLALCSLGLLGAGGAAVWANTTQRDAGYVDLGAVSHATSGRALASDTISVHGGWGWLSPLAGQIRIRVTETGRASGVFAGVAPASAARNYLAGVAYTSYGGQGQRIDHPGAGAPRPPGSAAIWAAQASGARTATLLWTIREGDWTVIVMNADRSAGVAVRAQTGASLPALRWLATQLLGSGMVLALAAFACILVPARLATASRAEDPGSRS